MRDKYSSMEKIRGFENQGFSKFNKTDHIGKKGGESESPLSNIGYL